MDAPIEPGAGAYFMAGMTDKAPSMIAYDEARQRILAACQPLAVETVAVALDRATGCALPQTPVTVSLRRSLRRRRQPVERRLLALRRSGTRRT